LLKDETPQDSYVRKLLGRSRQDIIATILKNVCEPTRKTKVIHMAHLSFDQCQSYLNYMRSTGLVALTPEKKWVITDKGRRYSELYNALQQLEGAVSTVS
jgi:predicted transcriptional regulator